MTDYELICDMIGKCGEEAIDEMISCSSNKKNLFKSTFSTTDIAKECNQINTVNQLNYFLKNMNILLDNGDLSQNTLDKKLAIIFKGQNRKGETYSQIRWTKKGKEYIKNITQSKLMVKNEKLVKDVEIKYAYQDQDTEVLVNVIVCTIQNEEDYYYELNQKIQYDNIAEKLVDKIKSKGSIDIKYWTCKNMEDYYSDYSEYSDFNNDDDDYYDDSEAGETKRMISNVSYTLGHQVDEDIARAFMHDFSKLSKSN